LKIALDEHIGEAIVEALTALSGEDKVLRCELVSARKYTASIKAATDIPWVEKFKADGGKIIISGDMRMRGKLHEQKALRDAGFTVFFPARPWNNLKVYAKTAMLIRWWPIILEKARSGQHDRFYEIPMSWNGTEFKEVTPPARKKPGRKKASHEESEPRPRDGTATPDAEHAPAPAQKA
jgi:hypothetical protein